MLLAEHVDKAFEGRLVLKNFSCRLEGPGVICLFGPSGCGKTTLLRLFAGLEAPDAGNVKCFGKCSMVFQEDRLLPWKTAAGNLRAVRDTLRPKEAEELLVQVGLAGEGGRYPHELSGGMKRRVAIARAFAFDGDLLLLDEPFRGLDYAIREQVMERVKKFGENGLVVLVTHDREEALTLGDSLWLLEGPPLHEVKRLKLSGLSWKERAALFDAAIK